MKSSLTLLPCSCGGTVGVPGSVLLHPSLNILDGRIRYTVKCSRCKKTSVTKGNRGFLSWTCAVRHWNQQNSPPTQPLRRIVSAAMLMDDGLVVPGARHFSPDMRAVLKRIYGDRYHARVQVQGFIDTHGNFLDRKEAYKHASYNNQILKRCSGDTDTLYSENLY